MHYLWSADLSKKLFSIVLIFTFLNSFCQYLSFRNIFFNRFCPVEKRGVTPHCLYHDSLALRVTKRLVNALIILCWKAVILVNSCSRSLWGCAFQLLLLISRFRFSWSVQKQPPEGSYKKGFIKNLAKFTGKHLVAESFLNKVAGLRLSTLLRKRLWHRCFSVNFAKFLRVSILQNTSG